MRQTDKGGRQCVCVCGGRGGQQRHLIFITSGFKRTLVMMIHSIRGIRISLMGQTANMCARPPFHTWVFFPTPPAVPRRRSLRRGRAADTGAPVQTRRNICVGKREARSLLRRAGCYLSEGPLCAANIWWTPGSYIVEAPTGTEGLSAGRWPGQSGGEQLAEVKGQRRMKVEGRCRHSRLCSSS